MNVNMQKYLAFIKTVEYGSFTKAAQMLNYSQSGISRMISDLESEWQITLLERSRAGVELTSDGLKILPQIKKLCYEYQSLAMQIDELKGLSSGLIRIGTFSSAATHWLPKIIKAFQSDYPQIDYELLLGDYDEIKQWIIDGRVDCGFLLLPAPPELETIFLEQDEMMAVLSPHHPLAKDDTVSITALCAEPFMLLQKGSRTEMGDLLTRCGLHPNVRFTTWDDYAIMSMVESGLGVSILPQLILKRQPYDIAVRKLSIPAYRDIAVAMRSKKQLPLAAKKFLEYLDCRNS